MAANTWGTGGRKVCTGPHTLLLKGLRLVRGRVPFTARVFLPARLLTLVPPRLGSTGGSPHELSAFLAKHFILQLWCTPPQEKRKERVNDVKTSLVLLPVKNRHGRCLVRLNIAHVF